LKKNFFEEQQILNKNIVFSKGSFFNFSQNWQSPDSKKSFFEGQQILNQGQGVFEDKFSSVSFEEMAESSLEKHGRVPVFLEEQRKIQNKLVFKVLPWKRTGVQGVFTCDPVFYVCWLHTIKRHVSRVIKLTLLG
jgi:hypothetical protein